MASGTRERERIREALMSASLPKARRLVGFVAAVARLAGTTVAALRAGPALAAACAAIADMDGPGPAHIAAVRKSRRTVGHTAATDADVRLVAAALVRRRTLAVRVHGPLVPAVSRLAGIRPVRVRRWSPDDAADAEAVRALTDLHRNFGIRCVTAPPGSGWVSALVMPQLNRRTSPDRPAAHAGVLDEIEIEIVAAPAPDAGPVDDIADAPQPAAPAPAPRRRAEWDDDFGAMTYKGQAPHPSLAEHWVRDVGALVHVGSDPMLTVVIPSLGESEAAAATVEAEEASLVRRITAALSDLDPAAQEAPMLQVAVGFDGNAAVMLSLCGHGGMQPQIGRRVASAVPYQLQRGERSAIARFRRTLPPDLQDCAGLCRGSFGSPHDAARFIRARNGHSPEDGRRILEAFRMMGCLRPFHQKAALIDAMRSGRRIESQVAAALGLASGPLPRTARTLRGPYHHGVRHSMAAEPDLRLVCGGLDGYYAQDSHRPILTAREQHAALLVLRKFVTGNGGTPIDPRSPTLALALAANRNASGRIVPPSEGIHDVFAWLEGRCRLAFGSRNWAAADTALHNRQAAAILYPPQRRAEALARIDRLWHAQVVALSHEHDVLVASLRGTAAPAAIPDYPHLMDAPLERDGVLLTPLRGPDAVSLEGRELSHCIATYEGEARSGRCMLVSLASPDGRSSAELVATFSDSERGGKPAPYVRIAQHRGPRNGIAPESHDRALRSWIASIPAEALAAAARTARDARSTPTTNPYHGIGKDGMRRLAALARSQIEPYLSGSLKDLDARGWRSL